MDILKESTLFTQKHLSCLWFRVPMSQFIAPANTCPYIFSAKSTHWEPYIISPCKMPITFTFHWYVDGDYKYGCGDYLAKLLFGAICFFKLTEAINCPHKSQLVQRLKLTPAMVLPEGNKTN